MHHRIFSRVSACLIASAFALVLNSCASSEKEKEEAILHARIGTALLQQGRYPDALRELLIAEKMDPKNAATKNNLGLAYFMRERYKTAAEKLREATELDPKYTEARNNYGRVLIELEQFDLAEKQLRLVIGDLTYPDPAKAYVNLGLAFFRQSKYNDARGAFARAIKINRENCLAQTYYGRSLFELSKFGEASDALDNAVLVCKESGLEDAHYYSGLSYYKLGKTSSAISRMEDVVRIAPHGPYAKKAQDLLKLMK